MRAIDGDALLKRVQQEEIQEQVHGREFSTCFLSPGGIPSTEWWYVEDLIESAPTIEPEQRGKGKWIVVDDAYNRISGKCSVCGWEAHMYEDDVVGMDYCPNCGARMEDKE